MEITFSVIIPIYNVEDYLEQCLESVIKQTRQFDEVILVNDGSTDNSLEICKKYASKYKYFKLISQKNSGQAMARNRGIELAKGEYIAFLDADDWIDVDLLSILKEKLNDSTLDVIYFDADIFQEDMQDIITENSYDRSKAGIDGKKLKGMEYFRDTFPSFYVVSPCLAIYRRDLLMDNGIRFPEGIYFEDNLFSFLVMKESQNVIHISNKVYFRRYRLGSTTISTYSKRKFNDFIVCINLIWKNIDESELDFVEENKELLLSFINGHCSIVLDNYKRCLKEKIILDEESQSLLSNLQSYFYYLTERICPEFQKINIAILNRILLNLYNMDCLGISRNYNYISRVINALVESYKKILKALPLNKMNIKIGMYGTGKHTDGLLSIYERLIGEISCDIVFLDSNKDSGIYRDRKIINIKKIDKSFDLIIISSFLFEKQMIEYVKQIQPTIRIYTFYNTYNEDIFSQIAPFLIYYDKL